MLMQGGISGGHTKGRDERPNAYANQDAELAGKAMLDPQLVKQKRPPIEQ